VKSFLFKHKHSANLEFLRRVNKRLESFVFNPT